AQQRLDNSRLAADHVPQLGQRSVRHHGPAGLKPEVTKLGGQVGLAERWLQRGHSSNLALGLTWDTSAGGGCPDATAKFRPHTTARARCRRALLPSTPLHHRGTHNGESDKDDDRDRRGRWSATAASSRLSSTPPTTRTPSSPTRS